MATNYTYLDSEGLSHLVEKLKTFISNADLATLQSANATAEEKDAIINAAVVKAQEAADAAKTSADEAQADVDALSGKIGTVPEGTTVMGKINALEAGTYDDSEVRGLIKDNADEISALKEKDTSIEARVKTNEDALAVLNGTGAGSVDKKVADAINKFATDVTDDAVINSYKELIDWVATHGSEAAEMADAIEANEGAIADLEALVGTLPEGVSAKTIVALIQELVGAEQTRAEGVESGLAARIATLETKTSDTGSIATDISNAKEEAITTATSQAATDATTKANTAESNANKYTDEQVSGVQTSVDKNAGDIASLTTKVNTNTTDISNLKTAVNTTLPNSISEAKTAATNAQSDVDALEKTVATNTGNISTVTDRVAALEATTHTHSPIATSYIDGLF